MIDSKVIKVVLVYRPSNPSNNGKLELFLERLGDLAEMNCNVDGEMILMGDLNINMLENTCHCDSLSELMDTFNLKLLNHIVPTRVANTSSTLLDHIYSNLDCSFKINVEQVSFSDHDCVECEFEI
jgi:endonuclease/exonuclease/phosphatase family metal-dependent hydrolase